MYALTGCNRKPDAAGTVAFTKVLLQRQVAKASSAKIVGMTRPTIYLFIETRKLGQ
jgi:hypothetical protein